MSATLNLNVGLMGHVDSGKTSLARILSSTGSTAAFDKHPQSLERGITLDLGFSALNIVDDVPKHLINDAQELQLTLVDCPGHASLIKTVLLGAQIVDLVLLVVDVIKGMQTQTAECLVLADIVAPSLVVAINKVDLVPEEKRAAVIDKMTRKLRATLKQTRFDQASIVAVSTREPVQGIDELKAALVASLKPPQRVDSTRFLMAVDHCFVIKGQGTVATGTVLKGGVNIGDNVEVSSEEHQVFKVRSMQMFKKPVKKAVQGDRVALCMTGLDASKLERGLIFSPGSLQKGLAAIVSISAIPYFFRSHKDGITSKSKFHVTIGHETCLAQITLFQRISMSDIRPLETSKNLLEDDFEYLASLDEEQCKSISGESVFALLEFDRPVFVIPEGKILGSKLDGGIDTSACRLAFHGTVLHTFASSQYVQNELSKLKVFKTKSKEGVVERAANASEVICRSMFKKDADISVFVNLRVQLSTGEEGVIEGPFGQSGKFKVRINGGLKEETLRGLAKKKGTDEEKRMPVIVRLQFKRHVYSNSISQ